MPMVRVSNGGTSQPYTFHVSAWINQSAGYAILTVTYVDKDGNSKSISSPSGYSNRVGIDLNEDGDVTILGS